MPFYVRIVVDSINIEKLRAFAKEVGALVLESPRSNSLVVIHPGGVITIEKREDKWRIELHGSVYELANFIISSMGNPAFVHVIHPIEKLQDILKGTLLEVREIRNYGQW